MNLEHKPQARQKKNLFLIFMSTKKKKTKESYKGWSI